MQSKKFHLVPLLFLACTFQALSQSFSIGVSGGPAITDMKFSDDSTVDRFGATPGFLISTNLTWRFSKRLGLRTGLEFERKGSQLKMRFKDENGNPTHKDRLKDHFDFFAVPVMLQASFGRKVRCLVQVGQSVGFLVQQTSKQPSMCSGLDGTWSILFYPCSRASIQKDLREHNTGEFARIELAVIAGLGMETNLSERLAFQFLVRPSYGLTNLNRSSKFFHDQEIRSLAVAATVGLQWFLK